MQPYPGDCGLDDPRTVQLDTPFAFRVCKCDRWSVVGLYRSDESPQVDIQFDTRYRPGDPHPCLQATRSAPRRIGIGASDGLDQQAQELARPLLRTFVP